ncbi:hypothetical protein NLM33_46605 [Bradyrhizobium sp. CCGUVB1N3]|uniref:hypothetical protein n=1 Tax=Bradyrhizobium sp. CCGUVB1N3 TaxID=2949629 RepID=UPI0020B3F64C|nr:hypothetical protein [Bradyrhizobium sp. CCGUVB1N3]MCP3477630.1 hypothetical protein [Bradyrhizobium sp. CCGUVB1N3]
MTTVFASEAVLRRVAKSFVELGYATAGIPGKDRSAAKSELQALCPNAEVHYVFAGDDLFVDAKRWPKTHHAWKHFAAELASDPSVTPVVHGISPVTDG